MRQRAKWLFGALLFAGFWNKRLGVLGALGSVVTFLCTITIIPFMPDGWEPSAGGFPAMVGKRHVPDEGCGSSRCIVLSTEIGCSKTYLGCIDRCVMADAGRRVRRASSPGKY
ncbi:MAG: DUF417 family protein [Acidobacteriaceae bacterium]|nr:DUF417 family protein [Acidobacteriaceae bacterium]